MIEQAAYTWFNRFTALRFMDAMGLTNPRVVSPADGATRPEILAEAMAGNLPDRARPEIAEYLNGTRPAHDGQAEAYRRLLIHACNEWHGQMPYMFERADMLDRAEDYTELLMPDDLLSPDSILARLRGVMTEDACQDVEIIGWLYQFYISEKKDQVFAGLKKNIKIIAENIPAATQLFTPHWIVRYLLENSLGRLWMLNRPQSNLVAQMDYHIAPEKPETDFLRVERPEDIRICDPACGSGHMLTYAFGLLYAIYEEEGYEATEIPALILTHNLTGIEIDDRAGALAAFALAMKAAAKLGRRRFLRMEAKPDIVVLQNVRFTHAELQDVGAVMGRDLFTNELRETMGQFEHAKNFGSLIVPKLRDPAEALRVVESRNFGSDLLIKEVKVRAMAVLRMAEALSPKYHVVVANPPYKKKADLNDDLQAFLEANFKDGKYDLYQAFILRNLDLVRHFGLVGMITMQGWMFAPRYEAIRSTLLSRANIRGMAQLGERAFDSIGGEVVTTTSFVLANVADPSFKGDFVRLTDGQDEAEKNNDLLHAARDERSPLRFRVSAEQFEKVPGDPLVYWAQENIRDLFTNHSPIAGAIVTREGLATGSNATFLREWHEVSLSNAGFAMANNEEAKSSHMRWFPYVKGGGSRRWYGNLEHFVNWFDDGVELRNFKDEKTGRVRSHNYNGDFGFRRGFTWSGISGNDFAIRLVPSGFMFDAKGPMGFIDQRDLEVPVEGFLNSRVASFLLRMLAPTLDFKLTHVLSLPFAAQSSTSLVQIVTDAVEMAKSDWDAYETSWDFTTLPLLSPENRAETLEATYVRLRAHWQGMIDEMQRLEEENNRTFIGGYGLQDELTPEVPLEEITLTCNPAYRYGGKATAEELAGRLLQDTVAEFLHYAVGCMFGRYSLDAPGLILASQGEGIEEYLARVPEPRFAPDRDNVIPVLDADWFADDIVTRTREFLRVTFGEAKFRENLAFIERTLGKDLRKWFTRDFFDYHVRRYKKRPIYWMFSSPKGSFNALIYMHRYRPDTVSVVLNQYLREFIHKLEVERARLEKLAADPTATQGQSTKAQKDIGAVIKQITELTEWERDVVYPMAQQRHSIDMDDGVKRNYPLFAGALKPITGLEVADD
ncbi:BREX-1 system adenine-specific DNA-methyltransferase PglX [Neorhizobium galegae]|uniref:BREX-1 system adenine-specific DNA-methyltransferase PglX n=1 Tax=Neorhizobium galegae TaxID=399 RepID=UPI001FD8B58F|nr:BREX-1 system adenine-specific DNA-methyltransferase PglX [Neorhizobium galegae]